MDKKPIGKRKIFLIFERIKSKKMGKVIGIGGIFFKYKDEKAMKEWYENTLGLTPNDYGVLFTFNGNTHPKAALQLGTFPEKTDYFGKPSQQAMINFRVDDLVALHHKLVQLGTTICNEIETYPFGKFLHIEDPEGNRIELWEPIGTFDNEVSNEMR
jgi:predicted enzyme related to lactoylglutathione lyase